MGAFVVGGKALEDTAGTIAFQHLDDFAVTLDVYARLEFRHRLDDRLHLGEDQRGLKLIIGGRVDFAAWLAFRAEQMSQRKPGNEAGFAVTAWLALNGDAGLATAICGNAAVNGLHEFSLARQEFHGCAGKNALRDWRELKERNHTLDARQSFFLPRQSAATLPRKRRLPPWVC